MNKLFYKLLTAKYVFPFILILSVLIFLSHTAFTKTAVFADGKFYYSITRSIVKDFDIKFANEYEKLGVGIDYTNKDYVWNQYPPGVSFAWIPLFTIAEAISYLLSFTGFEIDTAGFGFIYQFAVALTNIILGVSGLYLIYLILKGYFTEKVALLTTATLFAATNLLFYIAVEPINSHAASFFASSLFIYYLVKHKSDKYYYFILGIIGGIVGLVRTQDALILLLPLILFIIENKRSFKSLATDYLLLTAGFVLAFWPQIYFWKKIFNTFWYSPYVEAGFNFSNPKFMHVLFNSQNGLFTITPIISFALLGVLIIIFQQLKTIDFAKIDTLKLFKTWRLELKKPSPYSLSAIVLFGLLYFLLQLFLISSWSDYGQGGSFSIRMIITTYPLLSVGMAKVIDLLQKKFKVTFVLLFISLLSSLNVFLIIRYLLLF